MLRYEFLEDQNQRFINKKIKQSHNTGFHHPPLIEESLTAPRDMDFHCRLHNFKFKVLYLQRVRGAQLCEISPYSSETVSSMSFTMPQFAVSQFAGWWQSPRLTRSEAWVSANPKIVELLWAMHAWAYYQPWTYDIISLSFGCFAVCSLQIGFSSFYVNFFILTPFTFWNSSVVM